MGVRLATKRHAHNKPLRERNMPCKKKRRVFIRPPRVRQIAPILPRFATALHNDSGRDNLHMRVIVIIMGLVVSLRRDVLGDAGHW